MSHLSRNSIAIICLVVTVGLTGCSLTATAPSTPVTAPAIKGAVFGGQQPVGGAHVYLYAANTAGYYSASSPATYSSVSLLQAGSGTTKDSSGNYYVTTAPTSGSFSITGDYTCTPGQEVYLYAVGGDSGSGTNSAIGLMAILGDCSSAGNFATATPIVILNEVTTVAAAYAMAGFAYDATHVSSPNNALALTGVKNAFANASNLASLASGLALATTPAGNGAVPQATVYTLANILAACINSTGPGSPACTNLLNTATSNGIAYPTSGYGTAPTDTATAAINIAHNPGSNVTALYNLPSAIAPFVGLNSQPNDFTLGITFTGGGLSSPRGIALDASGNLWVANTNSSGGSVVELSSTGAVFSQTSTGASSLPIGIAADKAGNVWVADYAGNSLTEIPYAGGNLKSYTGFGMVEPWSVAIDGQGNAWVANNGSPTVVTKFSSTGSPLSGSSGFTGSSNMTGLLGIAIDGSGSAWLPDGSSPANIVKLSSTGAVLSGTTGYTSSGFANLPRGIAVDGSGNAWVPSATSSTTAPVSSPNPPSLFELSNSGTFLSPSGGDIGAGIVAPYFGVALDGAGSVWVANTNYSVSEFTNAGAAVSPSTGYTGGQQGFGWGIAIDGSGDTWVANYDKGSITELIGSATPVITPICAGLPVTPTSDGKSSLGTRP
jgi:hypothetical protein